MKHLQAGQIVESTITHNDYRVVSVYGSQVFATPVTGGVTINLDIDRLKVVSNSRRGLAA